LSSITASGSRAHDPEGLPTQASPTSNVRRSGQWSATSPGDFPGAATTSSGPMRWPGSSSSSIEVPFSRANGASAGWIAIGAPVPSFTFMLARK